MRSPLAALLVLPLAACAGGDLSRSLGLTRDAPDEFQVVTRAPLVVPPNLGALPPPRPGAIRPGDLDARERGESTLAPATVVGEGRIARPSGGESALLSQAAVPPAGSDIRRRVDDEAIAANRPNRSLTDRILPFGGSAPAGTALDPERERDRLRANAAAGRPPVEGETPVVQPRQRSLLDRLF